MGKYMKKSKLTTDVTVVTESTALGVRTRAKTLALAAAADSSSSFIQLRNRHIEKPPLKHAVQQKQQEKVSSCSRMNTRSSVEQEEERGDEIEGEEGCFGNKGEILGFKCEAEDFSVEVSFGDNYLDFESRERRTRESTPCDLIKDPDTVATPTSMTRQASSTETNRRVSNNMQRNIPTAHEMDEFFACAEQRHQNLFIEKYNFDVVNEMPLTGRYEWVQVIP
ncbi:cyclin-dependent kinase inhibitor 3-like [Mercurialis annua]|uniref:cyclin-dependent kinase inhibitor 3-like n=1 Tax=Mercurialis annua TaxID=3986 RepID=UPI00215F3B66|nr:cyclin-dependent kinase inhibitor 3-like [Mercurialis annua]